MVVNELLNWPRLLMTGTRLRESRREEGGKVS